MKSNGIFFKAAVILCIAAGLCFAQEGKLPKIAVYVVGEISESEKRALGTEMLNALVRSGRYTAVERAEEFVALIDKEHIAQRGGAIDDSEISALGKRFGVEFICVADAAEAFGAYQVSARILNVETAEVMFVERANGKLDNMQALVSLTNSIVSNMFGIVKTAAEAMRDDKSGKYKAEVIKDSLTGIEMVFVMGGTFKMGCSEEKYRDCKAQMGSVAMTPVHSVTLDDFYIGKYEVTQKQWVQIMGKNPSPKTKGKVEIGSGAATREQWAQWARPALGKNPDRVLDKIINKGKKVTIKYQQLGPDNPVWGVSWDDIQIFITKLNEKTGKKYRLPTEAEWEYAARGGAWSQGYKFAGTDDFNELGGFSWIDGNKLVYGWGGGVGTAIFPVGSWKPNELGIYDMTGSVSEWVNDRYALYSTTAQTNPKGSETEKWRVVRGKHVIWGAGGYGGWDGGFPKETMLVERTPFPPKGYASRKAGWGFRLALDR